MIRHDQRDDRPEFEPAIHLGQQEAVLPTHRNPPARMAAVPQKTSSELRGGKNTYRAQMMTPSTTINQGHMTSPMKAGIPNSLPSNQIPVEPTTRRE